AEQRLSQRHEAGEVLFRPSSKGSSYLTLTWAFHLDMFKHISIEERGKKTSGLGLGSELYVLEDDITEPFSDLDDIFANYVEPMNDLVRAMVDFKNFKHGSVQEVEDAMRSDKLEDPNRIPYYVRFEPGKPGSFTLTWLIIAASTQQPSIRRLKVDVRPHVGQTHVLMPDLF
ncbi:hypothetical protein EON64_19045, partial [archaeon]